MPPTRTAAPAPEQAEPQVPELGSRLNPPLAAYVPLAGFLVLLALSAVLGDARHAVPAAASLTLFAVAVAGCSAVATVGTTVLLIGCAWLDYDGFVVGRAGTLSWHGRADAVRIAVLAGTALTVLALRAGHRHRSRSRRRTA